MPTRSPSLPPQVGNKAHRKPASRQAPRAGRATARSEIPLRRAARAFTLVEILVVVAVIAILVTLSLASVKRVLQMADEARCASRLRNIGQAISLYTSDHDMMLPGPIIPSFGGWYTASESLGRFLYPYLGLPDPPPGKRGFSKEFLCPVWEKTLGPRASDPANLLNNCYVVQKKIIVDGVPVGFMPWGTRPYDNPNGDLSENPMKLPAVWNPSENWMITELDTQGNFGATAAVPTPIHKTFRNTVFFDFHVEKVPVPPVQ